MSNIALFASGSGSNVENIITYFLNQENITFPIILCNNRSAFVFERAKKMQIPSFLVDRTQFYETDEIVVLLQENNIDLIVLAGFLWLIPQNILDNYKGKIINIHPALLPKYGGKGMYGDKVHKAVVDARESESGITIHHVNERFDEGEILFQAKCDVLPTDTADDVANKVHELEYKHFPEVIARFCEKL